jgi:hypothetical protein
MSHWIQRESEYARFTLNCIDKPPPAEGYSSKRRPSPRVRIGIYIYICICIMCNVILSYTAYTVVQCTAVYIYIYIYCTRVHSGRQPHLRRTRFSNFPWKIRNVIYSMNCVLCTTYTYNTRRGDICRRI